jgi:hypothetical protein
MTALLLNWRTSAGGGVLIAIGLLHLLFDVDVPGFTMDPGAAIAAGVALLMAKDHAVHS